MRENIKKALSLLMVFALVFSMLPVTAFAQGDPIIEVDSVRGIKGQDVDVNITLKNNPGVAGMNLLVSYDMNVLTLNSVEPGAEFKDGSVGLESYNSPISLVWGKLSNVSGDVTFTTLHFTVSEDAEPNTQTTVTVSYQNGDILNIDEKPIQFQVKNGVIEISDGIPGDVTGDGLVTIADVLRLQKHLARWNVTVDPIAVDVTGDGNVNVADLLRLQKYMARWDVEIWYGDYCLRRCSHSMLATTAKAATCEEQGNIAYWLCTKCLKYFSDPGGVTEVPENTIRIPALGHTLEEIPRVEPTTTAPGSTQGWKCSVCGKILTEPQPIDPLPPETSNIIYRISGTDTYLQELEMLGKIPAPTPSTYVHGKVTTLPEIHLDEYGYTFKGWFTIDGRQLTQIGADQRGDITLYAHWEMSTYRVIFNYDTELAGLINTSELKDVKYTAGETTPLPVLALSGYTFIGWSDESGKICTQIEPGSVGVRQFYANWISNRSKAWTQKKLGKPYVYGDEDVILFCYEIGKMTDVPIYPIEDFGYINDTGITQEVTKEISVQTSEDYVAAYSKAVEASTTGNATWTLSNGWTDSVSVSKEYATEHQKDVSVVESESKTNTGTWYVNQSSGGSSSTTTFNSADEYDLKTKTGNTKTYGSTDTADTKSTSNLHGYEVNGSLELGAKESIKASGDAGLVHLEGTVEYEQKLTVGGGYENKTTDQEGKTTTKKTGSDTDDGHSDQTGKISHTGSNTVSSSTWNNESGYSNSQTNSKSTSVAESLSEAIKESTGIGESYITTGDSSTTQGISNTNAVKDDFSSKVTYSKVTYDKMTVSYTTGSAVKGYHRWVMAATAHVFGVVGYDIAENSYFVYTYSIMDDDLHKFEDYSYKASAYDDNQSGLIDFCIPSEITDYVNAITLCTDGLEFNHDGVVTAYRGTDSLVIIPEYAVIDNHDGGRKEVVKVTSIAEGVFTGNENITGVLLSDFITEIPAEEFKGCTNLWDFAGTSVVKIGASAFADCPNLRSFEISSDITELGWNAFNATGFLEVDAANPNVVFAALNSGAKEIVVGLQNMQGTLDGATLTVPAGTTEFTLRAFGNCYENLTIVSYAESTKLNRLNIHSNQNVPLQLYSDKVTLLQVNVEASGVAAQMLANHTELNLYGEVNFVSGQYSLFARDASVNRVSGNLETMLNASGNIVTCNIVDNSNLLRTPNGEIIVVDAETFEKMLDTYNLYFEAQGGNCDVTTMEAYWGDPLIGLPVPEKEGYVFDGWYTEAEGGYQVTEQSSFSDGVDHTLYAHWHVAEFTVSWNEGTGYTIGVARTASPYANAENAPIANGQTVYFGDQLSVTYAPVTGYVLGEAGSTQITVDGNVTAEHIHVTAVPQVFHVSWNINGNYNIEVTRTQSPIGGGALTTLENGAEIYYGDELSIRYIPHENYVLTSSGAVSITVKGDVGGNNIYANSRGKDVAYTVLYRSSNGTDLGSTTVTYPYNTTNSISAPWKEGYATPGAQSVAWDSPTGKTITFYYTPNQPSTSQAIASGRWWNHSSSTYMDYSATAEYRNRTANSVQVRVVWTNKLSANSYYGYTQKFNASCNGTSLGEVTIITSTTWSGSSTSARTKTVSTDWVTVSVGSTVTSVSISGKWWDTNYSGTYSNTLAIPAY